jgi:hypothetical protein
MDDDAGIANLTISGNLEYECPHDDFGSEAVIIDQVSLGCIPGVVEIEEKIASPSTRGELIQNIVCCTDRETIQDRGSEDEERCQERRQGLIPAGFAP